MEEIEAERKQLGEGVDLGSAVEGKEDEAVRRHELGKDLAACAAG
jgi:hypothetical protein